MNVLVDVDSRGKKNVLVGFRAAHSELARALRDNPDTDLVIMHPFGSPITSLDVLRNQPIRALTLAVYRPVEMAPLLTLSATLETLNLDLGAEVPPDIDLSRFAKLRRLNAAYAVVNKTLTHMPNLRALSVSGYTDESLRSLHGLASITDLVVRNAAKLSSLHGVEASPLTSVTIEGSAVLKELTGLPGSLAELCLRGCPQGDTLDALTDYPALRSLEVGVCGRIASLRPLTKLRELTSVRIWETHVDNDDLEPLLSLPKLQHVQVGAGQRWVSSIADIERRVLGGS